MEERLNRDIPEQGSDHKLVVVNINFVIEVILRMAVTCKSEHQDFRQAKLSSSCKLDLKFRKRTLKT